MALTKKDIADVVREELRIFQERMEFSKRRTQKRSVAENVRIVRDVARILTVSYGHLGGSSHGGRSLDGDDADHLSEAADVLLRVKTVLASIEMERMDPSLALPADAGVLGSATPEKDEEEEANPSPTKKYTEPRQTTAPPLSAHCPLTHEVFQDPVITRYGHSYEREALLQALRADESAEGDVGRDPITRRPLRYPGDVVTNRTLKDLITEMGWKE